LLESASFTISQEPNVAHRFKVVFLETGDTGGPFATFTIESVEGKSCAIAQENGEIKGEDLCFFLEPIEEDAQEHLLECPSSGSELALAGTTAEFEAEFSILMLTPVANNSWSVVQGE
jgi:hypothetical protein